METTPELDALEERAYRATWDDGILDLILGVGLIMLGVLFRTELAGLAGVFVAVLLMPVWGVAKKLITIPRLGYVEFSADRKAKERGWGRQLVVLGVVTLALAVGLYTVSTGTMGLRETFTNLRIGYILFGSLIALGMAVAGFMIGLPRLKAHAAITLAATGIGYLTGLELEDYLLAAGIAISVWGGVILRRFLVRYPLPRDGMVQ